MTSRPLKLKRRVVREASAEHQIRDQEVVRANKVLAAYFKGRRTEREARAALKTIKAFVRDRERSDPKNRRPLPGSEPTAGAARKARGVDRRPGRVSRRQRSSPPRPRTDANAPERDNAPENDTTKAATLAGDGEPSADE